MKKLFYVVVSLCLLAGGCQKYDDTELRNDINDLKERVETLETLCQDINTDVTALKALVNSVETHDYITNVTPITGADGVITGYTISFANSDSVTIRHGMDGDNGQDGEDGCDGTTPVIGVRQGEDGVYYWTLNGDWLLDDDGNRIKASGDENRDGADGEDGVDGKDGKDGVTPQLKIEDGMWCVSYDNGGSWHEVGPATGEQGDSIFESVDYTSSSDYVIFTLADGTKIAIPRESPCPVEVSIGKLTPTTAIFNGTVYKKSLDLKVTIHYSTSEDLTVYDSHSCSQTKFTSNTFDVILTDLICDTQYYYFVSVFYNGKIYYSEVNTFITANPYAIAVSLSSFGSANSYIVSSEGIYSISAVKGNSSESVGVVAFTEVLWESFGTSEFPSRGDLVRWAGYKDGNIYFETNGTFREGNAVIAAKNASGTILWSWHIWLTDQPAEHLYYNNACTMMDRNLGATSATPGDVGALGLLYQWGRKDPFLGSSSINSNVEAESTSYEWEAEATSSSSGTIEYAVANPMTFITYNVYQGNGDWHYTSIDNTLWTESSETKSIYDPCPEGWRVPNGGDDGFWSKSGIDDTNYDSTNNGILFSISSPATTWYPASGYRHADNGELNNVGKYGICWSCSTYPDNFAYAYTSGFDSSGYVNTVNYNLRSLGLSVRCCRE